MILILGIANFKNGYGIKKKKVSLKNIKDIFLQIKKEKQIKFVDTAPSYYQDSKNYLIQLKNFKIFSKLKKIPSEIGNNFKKLENFVMEEINLDLKRLKVRNFEGYYVHDIDDVLKYGKNLFKIFKELKKMQLINKIGLSFYNLDTEIKVLKKFKPDIVQLPFNLLCANQEYKSQIKILRKKNISIFARSIYLQGIILNKWQEVPKKFPNIRANIKLLETKFGYYSKSKKIELTINEIKKNKFFDGIIFSVDSREDLDEFLKLYKKRKKNLMTPVFNKIRQKELDPREW
tara:strand:- start:62 stop:928 length:867 start_codon:yes stop_codon:yes gene_type:complete